MSQVWRCDGCDAVRGPSPGDGKGRPSEWHHVGIIAKSQGEIEQFDLCRKCYSRWLNEVRPTQWMRVEVEATGWKNSQLVKTTRRETG